MGAIQSSPRGEPIRASTVGNEVNPPVADVRKLLLKTLPVFIPLSSMVSAQPSSPVLEYLVRLGSASYLFNEYLRSTDLNDKDIECFALQLSQLAKLLDDMLDENFVSSLPAKVRVSQTPSYQIDRPLPNTRIHQEPPVQPWTRLHRLSESASRLSDPEAAPDHISKMFASLSQEKWKKADESIDSLAADIQEKLESEPVYFDPKPQPLEPFLEIFKFSEIVHSTLDCSVTECNVHHKAMLKLGIYKRGLGDYDSWHLCMFLAPPSLPPLWRETAMYRADIGRCVKTVKCLRHRSTDTTTARRVKCPSR
jgi:hypothetical protein